MTRQIRTTELAALLRLGAPVMLAQTFQIGMSVVDTVMAGRYSPKDLAGIALASSLIMPLQVLLMGTLHAVTPIVAQLHGGGRRGGVGAVVRHGVWVGAGLSLLMMVTIGNAGPVLGLFGVTPAVGAVAIGYMRAVLWGFPGLALYIVLRMTCEGLGHTRPPMIIAGLLLLTNIPLNYAFIYGRLGAPELGGVGCGVATAIIRWLQFGAMAFVMSRPAFADLGILAGRWRPERATVRRIFRIGLPIGLKIFGVVSLFAVTTLLLAPFGENAVAAFAVGGNVTTVIFMIPMGLGMAATIRIGHGVGAGAYDRARLTGRTAVELSAVYAAAMAVCLTVGREGLAAVYTDAPDARALIASLFLVVAAYQFTDCIQEVAICALRGYKDTRIPMFYALTGYWAIGFPVALACGNGWLLPELKGVHGFWVGFTVGEGFVALTASVRRMRLAKDPERIERFAEADGDA